MFVSVKDIFDEVVINFDEGGSHYIDSSKARLLVDSVLKDRVLQLCSAFLGNIPGVS